MLRCLVVLLTFFTLSAASAAQEDEVRIAPRPLQLAFGAIANGRAIRAYEKAGFMRLGERTTPFGPALIMAVDAEAED